jgi:site-specific DNA-methyltransferase (adenine-specific)
VDAGPYTNLPTQRFDIALIDPPWSYFGDQAKDGAAAKFYRTLSDEEILMLPVRELLNERAVAFVWATAPRLDAAMDAIRAWGLHYRGVAFVWVKTTKDGKPIGARGVRPSIVKPTCEFVLACSTIRRGRPLPIADESVANTVLAPTREHSAKPIEVHERIEMLYPAASKVELFARRARTGWHCWGDQINQADDAGPE